jgi:hypothetical protein
MIRRARPHRNGRFPVLLAPAALWLWVLAGPGAAQDACTLDPSQCVDEKAAQLEVTGWNGIAAFGSHAALAGTLGASDTLCVGAKGGLYTVTLNSAFGGSGFALSAGAWTALPYHVGFTGDGTRRDELTAGTPYLFSTDRKHCKGDGSNAELRIEIRAGEFNAAESGLYGDVLTAVFSVP